MMFMQREVSQVFHMGYTHSLALVSCLGGFIRISMAVLLKCKAPFY